MSVKVQDFTNTIEARMIQNANIFLRLVSEEVVKNSTRKTPMKTGALRRDVVKSVLGNRAKIEWGKNYAIFQEEKQFKNYTTPGTGPHFAENAVREVVNDISSLARQAGLIL